MWCSLSQILRDLGFRTLRVGNERNNHDCFNHCLSENVSRHRMHELDHKVSSFGPGSGSQPFAGFRRKFHSRHQADFKVVSCCCSHDDENHHGSSVLVPCCYIYYDYFKYLQMLLCIFSLQCGKHCSFVLFSAEIPTPCMEFQTLSLAFQVCFACARRSFQQLHLHMLSFQHLLYDIHCSIVISHKP